MATSKGDLIIGIGGHVVALDPATGAEFWRTKLKNSEYVTVRHDQDRVYAGADGELYALDRATGTIVWHNKLERLGLGLVTFSGEHSATVAAVAAKAAALEGFSLGGNAGI